MINARAMGLGSFDVSLREDTPKQVVDALEFFGHVVITPAPVDVRRLGDGVLEVARYTGVLRGKGRGGTPRLTGAGAALWLGDEDEKGYLYDGIGFGAGSTFQQVIAALRPPTVAAGTVHPVAGTYSGSHAFITPRALLDYICPLFGAEWRVNPNLTLDAGTAAQLYGTTPSAVLVRKGAGRDLDLEALPASSLEVERDVIDYTTRVILLGEGQGATASRGAAELHPATVPYRDRFGNPVSIARLVGESSTSTGNANTRAQLHLNRFAAGRDAVRLSTLEYDLEGVVQPGDRVYVYDPDTGLVHATRQVRFQGRTIAPVTLRVEAVSWPVAEGMGVYHRRGTDGAWLDLTQYVQFEDGDTEVEVGAVRRRLGSRDESTTGSRANTPAPGVTSSDPDKTPAAPALVEPFGTDTYLGAGAVRFGLAVVEWQQPLNTDGSVITDGADYTVAHRRAGTAAWSVQYVPFDEVPLTAALYDLEPGAVYDVRVRARNRWGRVSAAASTQVQVPRDTTAPSTPAAPTVAGGPLSIRVEHALGKATGGTFNLERDLSHLEVHAGAAAGFAPTPATLVASATAGAAYLDAAVPAVARFNVPDAAPRFVRVIAVDRDGNRSAPSEAVQVSAVLVQGVHIGQNSITAEHGVFVAGAIRTADIGDAQIVDAKIGNVSAGKVTAGTIGAHTITLGGPTSIIQSSNYAAGASGWQIRGDGVAEFQGVTVRGTLTTRATSSSTGVVVSGTDARFYYGSTLMGRVVAEVDAQGQQTMSVLGQRGTGYRAPALRLYENYLGAQVHADAWQIQISTSSTNLKTMVAIFDGGTIYHYAATEVQGQVRITSGSDVSNAADSGYLVLGSSGGNQIGIDTNEVQARIGSSAANININNNGGDTILGSSGGNLTCRNWSGGTGSEIFRSSGSGKLVFTTSGSGTLDTRDGSTATGPYTTHRAAVFAVNSDSKAKRRIRAFDVPVDRAFQSLAGALATWKKPLPQGRWRERSRAEQLAEARRVGAGGHVDHLVFEPYAPGEPIPNADAYEADYRGFLADKLDPSLLREPDPEHGAMIDVMAVVATLTAKVAELEARLPGVPAAPGKG